VSRPPQADAQSNLRRFALGLGALLLLALPAAAAPAPDEQEEQLRKIRARIETLQTQLNATRGRRDAVRDEVQGLERRIGTLAQNLRGLDGRLKQADRALERLRRQSRAQRQDLGQQTRGLERQMRAAYLAGRQEQLKLLLNQQDPATLARALTYYRYLNTARGERIGALNASLARAARLEAEIGARVRELAELHTAQGEKKTELEAARARRAELLASLNRQAAAQTQEMERLRADEERLRRLIGELETAFADVPLPPGARFAQYKGRLPLPIKGRVGARFGEPRNIGDLKWRGLFLAGREGQDVRAVFRGRVAYADWLRGFGLLLILEHGDGYMTLYGHNQSLHKQVGDWVEAGEPIAGVGSTGDAPRTGIYFEIRHHGEPHDPLIWCKAS